MRWLLLGLLVAQATAEMRALFVVGIVPLTDPEDLRTKDDLEAKGWTVTVVQAAASTTEMASSVEAVYISETCSSGQVGTKFTNVPIPVTNWEIHLIDELTGHTTPCCNVESLTALGSSTQLDFVDSSHWLALGRDGLTEVSSTPLYWGCTNEELLSGAELVARHPVVNYPAMFVYPKGSMMPNGAAAGDRIFLPWAGAADYSETLEPSIWKVASAPVPCITSTCTGTCVIDTLNPTVAVCGCEVGTLGADMATCECPDEMYIGETTCLECSPVVNAETVACTNDVDSVPLVCTGGTHIDLTAHVQGSSPGTCEACQPNDYCTSLVLCTGSGGLGEECTGACSSGAYESGSTCLPCPSGCGKCEYSGTGPICVACSSPDATVADGVCVCDRGYYYEGGVCTLCSVPSGCVGAVVCDDGDNSRCEECMVGTWKDEQTLGDACLDCEPIADIADLAGLVYTCTNAMNTIVTGCPSTSECCEGPRYLDSSLRTAGGGDVCTPCLEGCATCTSESLFLGAGCFQCDGDSGYYDNRGGSAGGECVPSTNECAEGYFSSSGGTDIASDTDCIACRFGIANCLTCSQDGSECYMFACPEGQVLDERECVSVCPAGKYADGLFCTRCNVACATCAGPNREVGAKGCNSCNNTFGLFDSNGIDDGGVCAESCGAGYFSPALTDDTSCAVCIAQTGCLPGRSLSTCLSTKLGFRGCEAAVGGYFISSLVVEECPEQPLCVEGGCTSATDVYCTSCVAGSFLNATTGICEICPLGLVAGEGSDVCVPCLEKGSRPNARGTRCECAEGVYSDGKGRCLECPRGATCSGGDGPPENLEGFYCIDDFLFSDCEEGYCLEGCECRTLHDKTAFNCATCSPGAFMGRSSRVCEQCPNVSVVVLVLAGLAAVIILALLLLFVATRAAAYLATASVALNFLQIIAVLGSFDVKYPPFLKEFFNGILIFTINIDILNPECAFSSNGFRSVWLLKMLAPVAVAVAIFSLYFSGRFILKRRAVKVRKEDIDYSTLLTDFALTHEHRSKFPPDKRFRYLVINVSLMMLNIVFLMLTYTAFQAYDCSWTGVEGQKILVMDSDARIQCYTSEWMIFGLIGTPLGMVYTVGIPVALVLALRANRYKLRLTKTMLKYGLLYRRYAPHVYFWEVVILQRKLVFIGCAVFLSKYPMVQVSLGLVTTLIHVVATFRIQPMATRGLNRLEMVCLCGASLILTLGLCFGATLTSKGEFTDASYGIGAVCIIVVVFCLVAVTVSFIREIMDTRKKIKGGIHWIIQEDLAIYDEFFTQGVRVVALHKAFDQNTRLRQVRLVFTSPGTPEDGEWSFRVMGGDFWDAETVPDIEDAVTLADNILYQTMDGTGKHTIHMVDVLLPTTGALQCLEVLHREKDVWNHVMHARIPQEDHDDFEETPRTTMVVPTVTETMIAKKAVVFSPASGHLLPGTTVTFVIFVPGALDVKAARHKEQEAVHDNAAAEALLAAYDGPELEKAQERLRLQGERTQNTTLLDVRLDDMGGGLWRSEPTLVAEFMSYEVQASLPGSTEGFQSILTFSTTRPNNGRGRCQFCEVYEASISCLECDLLYCDLCSRSRHSRGKRRKHTLTPVGLTTEDEVELNSILLTH